jgi:iron complex transport system ATP-binding protein
MNGVGLELRSVHVRLGGQEVLRGVSASLRGGSLTALLGPNGAGKTTLLRAIAGLVPSAGRILLAGADLAALSLQERARRIAYLPQGHVAHWPLPVRDVVALGRYASGARDPARLGAADRAIVDAAMQRTDCLGFAERNMQTLSGGERARAMLARVLAAEAPVILADEPTAALDPRHQLAVMGLLQAEARRGALVVAVTHDITLAARFADRVILLDGGVVAAEAPPDEALDDARMAAVYGVSVRRPIVDGQAMALPWSALP